MNLTFAPRVVAGRRVLLQIAVATASDECLVACVSLLCPEERYLEKEERLLDMVAYWQRLFNEEKKAESNSYRMAYKVRR